MLGIDGAQILGGGLNFQEDLGIYRQDSGK